MQQFDTEKG